MAKFNLKIMAQQHRRAGNIFGLGRDISRRTKRVEQPKEMLETEVKRLFV